MNWLSFRNCRHSDMQHEMQSISLLCYDSKLKSIYKTNKRCKNYLLYAERLGEWEVLLQSALFCSPPLVQRVWLTSVTPLLLGAESEGWVLPLLVAYSIDLRNRKTNHYWFSIFVLKGQYVSLAARDHLFKTIAKIIISLMMPWRGTESWELTSSLPLPMEINPDGTQAEICIFMKLKCFYKAYSIWETYSEGYISRWAKCVGNYVSVQKSL